jgi:hypothetical protein
MNRTKPYIQIERGTRGTHAIHLVMPNGSRVDVAITRTDANAAVIDYFYEKLKDGVNL